MTDQPGLEYLRRRDERRAAAAREEGSSRRIWLWRRVVFAAGAGLVVLTFLGVLAPWWLLLPVIVFIAMMVTHQQVIARRDDFTRAADFYERGIARLEDRWAGSGEMGERFADKSHPYAEDLDLFGPGSLFELLSTARTRAGEERLAAWLCAPAAPAVVRARQEAIAELRPRLELREDLALLASEVRTGVHAEELSAWAGAPPVLASRAAPLVAGTLGALTLLALLLWLALGYRQPLLVAVMAEGLFLLRTRAGVGRVIGEVERPGRDLKLLAHVLARLERERFASPRLAELRAALDADGEPPSRQIARLGRLTDALDWTKNQFFAPFAFLLLLPTQIAYAIDRWRRRSGPAVARWLDAVAELEALGSLAGYAYEHPADPFPELAEGGACFEGEGLGHPLLPEARAVRNDVSLGSGRQVLIVSGSNMSGKSTMLRAVGTNAVLALAGAPVRARRLRLSPLAVGASIHILDSLQSGSSRFYAEITRLRQIVDLTRGGLPLLFLLDEILSGTNSHDRRIGAEAVVRGLAERGAIGLLTTHDLALTEIAAAENVHFEDRLEGGKMVFDYRMRPGVVRRSNALELMRVVGLEV